MKYFCTLLLLTLSLWARGQSKPLTDRVAELEAIVEKLVDRVETLEAVNRVLAAERKRQTQSNQVTQDVNVPPDTKTEKPAATPAKPSSQPPLMLVTPTPEAQTQRLSASPTPSTRSSSVSPRPSTPRPRTSTRTYYRGSRGGCYYINSNGNKTYVDRSMCN